MMAAAISPRAEELATKRSQLLKRAGYLAPNSARGREVRAEIRQLAAEELKLEVAEQRESQKSGKPEISDRADSSTGGDERPPRFWWIGEDR